MDDIVKFMKLVELHKDMSGVDKKNQVINSVKFRNQGSDKELISAIIDNLISIEKGEIKIKEVKKVALSLLNCCK